MLKRSDLESLPFKGVPTDPILTASIQPDRVQEIEVRGDHLYLPIMHGSDECDIPLISVVQSQQMFYHQGRGEARNFLVGGPIYIYIYSSSICAHVK